MTTQSSTTSTGPRPSSGLLAVPSRPVVDITPRSPRLFQLQIRGKKTTVVQLNDLTLPPIVESAASSGPLLVVEDSVQEEGSSATRRRRVKRTILQLDQLPVSQTELITDPILDAEEGLSLNDGTESGKVKRGRRKTIKLDDLPTPSGAVVEEPLLPVEGATEEAVEVEEDEPSTKRKRGKTKTVKLKEIPQGALLPLESLELPQQEEKERSYPAVIQQHRQNMQKFDNCVLLTRVGGFYEMYFEHAEEVGPLLNLKVAQRKTNCGSVPMVNHSAYPDARVCQLCHLSYFSNPSTTPFSSLHFVLIIYVLFRLGFLSSNLSVTSKS